MADKPEVQQFLEQANRRLALVRDRDLLHDAIEKMHKRYVRFREDEKLLPPPNRPALVPPGMDRASLNRNLWTDIEKIAVRAEALQSDRNKQRQNYRVKDYQKTKDDGRER